MDEHCLMTGHANRSSSFDLQCQFKSTGGMTKVNLIYANDFGMPCFEPYKATPMDAQTIGARREKTACP